MDIAVIGAGRGTQHSQWMAACQEFTIVGIAAQKDEAAAIELVTRHPGAEVTRDALSLIRKEGLKGVVVATPTHAHEALVAEALRRDLLVVCETPLAESASAALKLAELATSRGSRAYVPFQWRENTALQSARSIILEGSIGELVALDIEIREDSHVGPGTPAPWREQANSAGAGALADLGCHAFDLLLWATGIHTWEVASAWAHRIHDLRRGPGPVAVDVDDVAQVELRPLGHEARARAMVSRVSPEQHELEFTALGTRGTVRVVADTKDGSAVFTLTTGSRSLRELTGAHDMNPYRRLASDLTTGSVSLPTFDDGLAAVNLLQAARQASIDSDPMRVCR